MFESHSSNPTGPNDLNKSQNQVPNNLPTEPEDMLAGVDVAQSALPEAPNALKSGFLKPKENPTILPNPEYSPPAKSETIIVQNKKPKPLGMAKMVKLIFGILLVFGVIAAGYGAWMLYQKYSSVNNSNEYQAPQFEIPNQNQNNNSTTVTPVGSETVASSTSNEVVLNEKDSDGDALSDSEETRLGTDILKPDTDGDLLSDMDEVNVWFTDPLKKDTDGDGYDDSSEIMNGYNPSGSGKFTPTIPYVRTVTSSPNSSSTFEYINNVIKIQ